MLYIRLEQSVFFFASRRRHTRCLSDGSSDVCSSDLVRDSEAPVEGRRILAAADDQIVGPPSEALGHACDRRLQMSRTRSEERRVGKECRSPYPAAHGKKNKHEGRENVRAMSLDEGDT